MGAWADQLPDPLALLRPLVQDENPRVRLQAVVACAYVPKAEAMEVAAIAADFPTDRFLGYALNQAVFALKPFWLPAFKSGSLNLANQSSRLGLLVRADATPDTLQTVRDLLKSSRPEPAAREAYLHILADHGDANDLASILNLSDDALQARLLPALTTAARVRRVRPAAGDLAAALRPLFESKNVELRAGAIRLAGEWKLASFRATAEDIALDVGADEKTRRAAIAALASFGGDTSEKILSRLAGDPALPAQSAAIAALCALNLEAAARIATASFAHLNDEAGLVEVFTSFLQRQSGAAALANALAAAAKPPTKLAAEIGLRLMTTSGRRNEHLARLLTEAAGYLSQAQTMTPAEIVAFVAEVRAQGDAKAGADVFRRPQLGCLACHSVNGEGGNIGPNLSALGTAQPVDFIVGAILDPQKEVKEGYMSISVATKDGEEYQGYQVRETGDELVLRDALQNQEVHLRRDAIKQKKQNGSVMPGGLADTLTRAEFRDLVRFLSELGKPK